MLFGDQIGDLHQEPAVDLGDVEDVVHAQAAAEGVADNPDTLRARRRQKLSDALGGVRRVQIDLGIEAHGIGFQPAHRLLQGFLQVAADGHHLAHGFHLRGEHRIGGGELLEVEARNLGDHVIDGRLEGGRGGTAGDLVLQLIKGVAHRQLGGHLGDREAGGLGGQRRGAGHPRVHFDHHHAAGVRAHAELHVGAAGFHADLAQHRQGGVAHHLEFLVGERLRRRHGDRVTGVHAHRVEVLDGTHDDAVVVLIADNLHLVLFPAQQRFVDQQLVGGRQVEAAGTDFLELFLVVRHPAAGAAHRERRPDNGREAQLLLDLPGFLHGFGDLRLGALQADVLHRLVEAVAVLGLVDGVGVGADHLDTEFVQNAVALQIERAVQRGLAAHGGQQRVRTLALNDLGHRFPGDGFDVGGVGHGRIGHDGGRVGIHQNHPEAFLAQGLARLGTGVVELAGLADHDRTGANDEDALNISPFRHV